MNNTQAFTDRLITAAEALERSLRYEDEARRAWDECGCGTPELEAWERRIHERKKVAAELRAAIDSLREAPQGEAVAGWKLAPVEPSIEMVEGGSIASDYDLSQDRCRRVWSAMLTAAPPAPAPAGGGEVVAWQPIETAPKDAPVLVSCPHGIYVVEWCERPIKYWHVDDNKHGPYALRGAAPTHWMPLPAAPGATPTSAPPAAYGLTPISDLVQADDGTVMHKDDAPPAAAPVAQCNHPRCLNAAGCEGSCKRAALASAQTDGKR